MVLTLYSKENDTPCLFYGRCMYRRIRKRACIIILIYIAHINRKVKLSGIKDPAQSKDVPVLIQCSASVKVPAALIR